MNNIEELKYAYHNVELTAHNMRGKPEEYRVVTGFCSVNVVEIQAQKIQALITQLEAAQQRIDELEIYQKEENAANRVLSAELSAANEKLSKPVKLP
ncbi:hypothetical protein, partial [Yersinia pekkanenii]|uniref:hypothetical protein n=1 Tax=Yersinia pekkanenii TaxID=1288385 RepID=UPI00066FDAAD